MVESNRLPAHRDVAGRAIFHPCLAGELSAVHVFRSVAFAAFFTSRGKARRGGHGCRCDGRRRVAIDALHVLVRTLEREPGLFVLERLHFSPLLGRVALLARQGGLVRILMACVAGQVGEAMLARHRGKRDFLGRHRQVCRRCQRLVAIAAGHPGVPPGQGKAGRLVALHRKHRQLEARLRVALLAAVEVGRGGELARVRIRVAGRTDEFARAIHRRAALRLVALGAAERGMLALQREGAPLVHGAIEPGRVEASVEMAGGAVRTGDAPRELPSVGILVAVAALLVGDGTTEIVALVAIRARSFGMLPSQRKLRGAVIESFRRTGVLPAAGVVAAVAVAREARVKEPAAVRILVAALAGARDQPLVVRLVFACLRPMALLAGNGLVQTGERERRARMIEPWSRLPCVLGVAVGAVGAKLAPVPVFMTVGAIPAQPEERPVGILDLDFGPGGGWDSLRVVAGLARLRAVLSGERETGLGKMIEAPTVEPRKRKPLPIVFHVTTRTVRLGGGLFVRTGVESRVGFQPPADLGVAVQTFKAEAACTGSEIVT